MPSFSPTSQARDPASRLDLATARFPEPDDAEHDAAWGFADTEFRSDDQGTVRLTGHRYELCNLDLPDLIPFAREVLSVDADLREVYEPLPPVPLPATLCGPSLLDGLRTLVGPEMVAVDDEPRRRHAHGHTQEEIFNLRYGRLARVPDLVVFPSSEEQVVSLVRLAREHGACVIPFGGGTNVTEALRCPEEEARPIISVDMRRMNRILWIDEVNRTACVEAGAVGRHLEAILQTRGYTLGHEPDSIEFSTLGGWIATRSSGMKKNRYGNIEDLLVDVRMVTTGGVFGCRAPNPRESTGLDARHLVLGSEGSLGVITSAVVKISPLPETHQYGSVVFRDFETGLAFLRELSTSRELPASVRLVDNLQFRFGLALKPKATSWRAYKSRIERWFVTGLKRMRPDHIVACTLVYEGDKQHVERQQAKVRELAGRFGGLPAGAENGRRGYQLTFGIAYIRDFLMKHYVLAESFETSTPWSEVTTICANVRRRVVEEHKKRGLPGTPFLSARVTQLYDSGVCIYFYLAFYFKGVPEPARVFGELELAARQEILAAGGSLSHHHGVGKIRRSLVPSVQAPLVLACARAAKSALDPANVFGARNNAFGVPEFVDD